LFCIRENLANDEWREFGTGEFQKKRERKSMNGLEQEWKNGIF